MWYKKFFKSFKKKPKYALAGDTVECIDDRDWNGSPQNMHILYGKYYKILQVLKCPDCGEVSYDIGVRFDEKSSYTTCGTHRMPGQGIHWAKYQRFENQVKETRIVLSEKHISILKYIKLLNPESVK